MERSETNGEETPRETQGDENEAAGAVEEQDSGFGDDVAEGGGGQTSPPPESVQDELTEGGTATP